MNEQVLLLTSKAQKPNPPSPPSLQGNGGFKASGPLSDDRLTPTGRGMEAGFCYTLRLFKQPLNPSVLAYLQSQPVAKVLPKKDQPYLILWRDNLNGDVSIKLYDGKKFIQNISSRTASDGVYEWTPRIPVKEGYFVRIYSWKDRNVFGELQL